MGSSSGCTAAGKASAHASQKSWPFALPVTRASPSSLSKGKAIASSPERSPTSARAPASSTQTASAWPATSSAA